MQISFSVSVCKKTLVKSIFGIGQATIEAIEHRILITVCGLGAESV